MSEEVEFWAWLYKNEQASLDEVLEKVKQLSSFKNQSMSAEVFFFGILQEVQNVRHR